jgi:hypothetical protein
VNALSGARLAAVGVATLAALGTTGASPQRASAVRPHSYVVVLDVTLVDFPEEREDARRTLLNLFHPPYRQALAISSAADTAEARSICVRTRRPCDILHVTEGPAPLNQDVIAIRLRWTQVTGSPMGHGPTGWDTMPCGLPAQRVRAYRRCREFMLPDVASTLRHHDERYHD